MKNNYNKYITEKRLQTAFDNDEAVEIGAQQATHMRRDWSQPNNIRAKRQELTARHEQKKRNFRKTVALGLAAAALGVGVYKADRALNPGPVLHGEKIVKVKPNDTLDGLMLSKINGIEKFDYREIRDIIVSDPASADVLADEDGVMVHPNEKLVFPKSVE